MRVVNSYFNGFGLYFTVVQVNPRPTTYAVVHGANIGNQVEAYVKSFHSGNQQYLNIYTVGQNTQSSVAGWSSFPWDYQNNPGFDGIVYDYNYLPGGKNVNYNTGKIMAHEIGHWVGLLHTFEGVSSIQ